MAQRIGTPDTFRPDLHNFVAATEWAIDARQEHLATQIAIKAWSVITRDGPLDVAVDLLDRILAGPGLTDADRSRVLLCTAELHHLLGDDESAMLLYHEAHRAADAAGIAPPDLSRIDLMGDLQLAWPADAAPAGPEPP